MKNFYISIVLSFNTDEYNNLQTGDIVELQNGQNNVDPSAIEVLYNQKKVGFIANSQETILPNSLSANHMWRLITDKKVANTMAVLRNEVSFTNKANQPQRRFLAEAFFVPARNATSTKDVVLAYEVGGTAAQNPGKSKILSEIVKANDASKPIDISVNVGAVQISDKKYYKVFMQGESEAGSACGEICNPDKELEGLLKKDELFEGRITGAVGKQKFKVELRPKSTSIDKFWDNIDAAIGRCVDQSPVIEEKVQAMINSGFSTELINAVLQQMPTLGEERCSVPKPKQLYYQVNGSNLADMVSYMLFGKMVRLVGEKGAGKNTLVESACWLLNRPMCRVQGSSEMDKMDIQGSASLENGNTGFVLSEILNTLQNDGIVVLDEANSVRPDVLMLFHSLTDNARSINVPGYGAVHMGDHACVVYTLNEDYVGTGEMNPATIDRGPSIIVKQESDIRMLLTRAVPAAKEQDINLCAKISDAIQKSVKESGILTPEAVTIRGFIDALECVSFIPLKRSLVQNVANKAQSENERVAIEQIITSYCA